MPIDVALLGCAHPHVPDVLGVVASEPDLRLVAAWDAGRSSVPATIAAVAVARAETAIRRAHAVVICAPTGQRPALCVRAARAGRPMPVEKPVASSAAESQRVALEVGRSATPAMAALALGRWADAPLTVSASWAARPGGLELQVVGGAGTATVRGRVLELARHDGEPERWVGAPPDAGEAVRAFAARVLARRFPCSGLAPAIRAQAVLEGAATVA